VVVGWFYGFFNVVFVLFVIGVLLLVVVVGDGLVCVGCWYLVGVVVVFIGVVVMVFDVVLRWGSDFGGLFGLVFVFVVFMLFVLGVCLLWCKVVFIGVGMVVLLVVVLVVDWMCLVV